MKILQITKFFPESFGGIEYATENTCKILSTKYRQIDILSFSRQAKKIITYKVNSKIKIIKFPSNIIIRSCPISLKMFFF